jgi:peptide/nickel transport system substrate-binding protein
VFDQRIVQAIHQMLLDVGLRVNIVSMDLGTFCAARPAIMRSRAISRSSAGPAPARTWTARSEPLFHSRSTWTTWRNPDMDRELEAARGTLDANARLQHYRRVHEMIAENALAVPLFQTGIIYGANRQLEWTPTPNESLFIARMRWRD